MKSDDTPSASAESEPASSLTFADVMTARDSLLNQSASRVTNLGATSDSLAGIGFPESTFLCSAIDPDAGDVREFAPIKLYRAGEPRTDEGQKRIRDMVSILGDKKKIDTTRFYSLLEDHVKENGIDGLNYLLREANRDKQALDGLTLKVDHEPLTKAEMAEYKRQGLAPPTERGRLTIEAGPKRTWPGCPSSQFLRFERPVNDLDSKILNIPIDCTQCFIGKDN